MMYAAYASAGREFDARDEARNLCAWADVPRKVEMIRRGTSRTPEPVTFAYLPNYVFLEADDAQWHALRGCKLIRGLMPIGPGNARRVFAFLDRVETAYQADLATFQDAQRIIENTHASKEQRQAALLQVQQYKAGQKLEVLHGPLAGQLVTFRAATEGLEIVADIEAFGQAVTVRVDPLHVKARAK